MSDTNGTHTYAEYIFLKHFRNVIVTNMSAVDCVLESMSYQISFTNLVETCIVGKNTATNFIGSELHREVGAPPE